MISVTYSLSSHFIFFLPSFAGRFLFNTTNPFPSMGSFYRRILRVALRIVGALSFPCPQFRLFFFLQPSRLSLPSFSAPSLSATNPFSSLHHLAYVTYLIRRLFHIPLHHRAYVTYLIRRLFHIPLHHRAYVPSLLRAASGLCFASPMPPKPRPLRSVP